jgi:hypothetical protein
MTAFSLSNHIPLPHHHISYAWWKGWSPIIRRKITTSSISKYESHVKKLTTDMVLYIFREEN